MAKEVKELGNRRTAQEDIALQDKRTKLQERIDEFCRRSAQYLHMMQENPFVPADLSEEWVSFDDTEPIDNDLPSFDDSDDEENAEHEPPVQVTGLRAESGEETIFIDNALPAEQQLIPLPSTFGSAACAGRLKHLARIELSLRKGQANDALHALRMAIGQKSFVYWSKIRKGSTNVKSNYKRRLRNSDDARTLGMSIDQSAKVYISARRAMLKLGASKADQDKYKILTPKHVHSSTAVVDFNAPGQRNESLSWIWHAHRASGDDPTWLRECRFLLFAPYIIGSICSYSVQSELASSKISARSLGRGVGAVTVRTIVDEAVSRASKGGVEKSCPECPC